MFNRTLHHWKAELIDEKRERKEMTVSAYWDPEREDTPAHIAECAAAMATYQSGGNKHHPIAPAKLIESETVETPDAEIPELETTPEEAAA